MDQVKISRGARKLRSLLKKYSHENSNAALALGTLNELLDLAESKQITTPLKWGDVPCRYLFSEAGLGQYRDLEEAYANFKVEVTGGHNSVLDTIERIQNEVRRNLKRDN